MDPELSNKIAAVALDPLPSSSDKLNNLSANTMDPESSVPLSFDNVEPLTTNKPKSAKKMGKKKGKSSNSTRHRFRPRDFHMARILELLGVDLEAAVDDNAKLKIGFAKVDQQWIDKFVAEDWSDAFTEQGYLRIDCLFDMLPRLVNPPDAHNSLWKSYRRLKSACLGLSDFNKRNEAAEYYLVKPITSHPAIHIHGYVSHANFLAKRKDDPESPVELFFAEVFYKSNEVTVCCPLELRLLPPDIIPPLEKARFKRAVVVHPEGFKCSCCGKNHRYL